MAAYAPSFKMCADSSTQNLLQDGSYEEAVHGDVRSGPFDGLLVGASQAGGKTAAAASRASNGAQRAAETLHLSPWLGGRCTAIPARVFDQYRFQGAGWQISNLARPLCFGDATCDQALCLVGIGPGARRQPWAAGYL